MSTPNRDIITHERGPGPRGQEKVFRNPSEIDWGEGADEVVKSTCDTENPEVCESCT